MRNSKLCWSIKFFGCIDMLYILSFVVKDYIEFGNPVFTIINDNLNSAFEFGLNGAVLIALVSSLMMLSNIASGLMMIFCNKFGVYLSIIQFPFRMFLLISPTFYFLLWFDDYFSYLFLVTIVMLLDVGKFYFEIKWLKQYQSIKSL